MRIVISGTHATGKSRTGDPSGAIAEWLPRVRDAMRRVDLVVFVPIEQPDRVPAEATDARRLRKGVLRRP